MEKVKLKLFRTEIGALLKFALVRMGLTLPTHSTIPDLVIYEFGEEFCKVAKRIKYQTEPKKGFSVSMTITAARSLKDALMYWPYDDQLVIVLGKIDLALVNYRNETLTLNQH